MQCYYIKMVQIENLTKLNGAVSKTTPIKESLPWWRQQIRLCRTVLLAWCTLLGWHMPWPEDLLHVPAHTKAQVSSPWESNKPAGQLSVLSCTARALKKMTFNRPLVYVRKRFSECGMSSTKGAYALQPGSMHQVWRQSGPRPAGQRHSGETIFGGLHRPPCFSHTAFRGRCLWYNIYF